MRSLAPDSEYFGFLDTLRAEERVSTTIAPVLLMVQYPHLRREEAKAVCADWRASVRKRRTGPGPVQNTDDML